MGGMPISAIQLYIKISLEIITGIIEFILLEKWLLFGKNSV